MREAGLRHPTPHGAVTGVAAQFEQLNFVQEKLAGLDRIGLQPPLDARLARIGGNFKIVFDSGNRHTHNSPRRPKGLALDDRGSARSG